MTNKISVRRPEDLTSTPLMIYGSTHHLLSRLLYAYQQTKSARSVAPCIRLNALTLANRVANSTAPGKAFHLGDHTQCVELSIPAHSLAPLPIFRKKLKMEIIKKKTTRFYSDRSCILNLMVSLVTTKEHWTY